MESLTKAQQELYDWLVQYIREHQYPPSIRQMMQAMQLRSPAPVQSRLEHLRRKGYVTWTSGKARTLRLLRNGIPGVPILGSIAAGAMVEPHTENVEQFDLTHLFTQPQYFALRVVGDSMVGAMIAPGDVVLMRPVADPKELPSGTIVAARVEGEGTTLKYFFSKGNTITLKPANPGYNSVEVSADRVEVQGALVGVWRGQV